MHLRVRNDVDGLMHAIVFVYTTVSSTWPAALLPRDTEPQLEGMHAASSLEFKSRSCANKRLKTSPVAAPYTAKSPATAAGAPITRMILLLRLLISLNPPKVAGEFQHIRLKGVRKVACSTPTRGKADMYALRGSYARHKPHARPSHQNAARSSQPHQHHVGFRRRGCGRNMELPPEDFRRC